MNIKGIKIDKQLEIIKSYSQFDMNQVDMIDFKQSSDQDYHIIKDKHNYQVFYNNERDIYAALGYIFSHLNNQDYDIKRTRLLDDLGYMIDCARNAVPKIETLKRQIVNLSLMGYTYIGLYLEDLFEIESEPKFGYMRGRYTKAEIKDLIAFSKLFDIKVIPYIQTLAHLNAIFKHKEYSQILDINDIMLVDEPKTYELVEKMLVTVKDLFETNVINIGMDEAWMLGLGKYLSKNGYQNRMDIMIKHLNKVLELCVKHNIKASMWTDMFFHLRGGQYFAKGVTSFEDIKDMIPSDVELVYWDYYHTEQKDYDDKFESLKTLTSNYAFAGGAWKWVGFVPFNGFSKRSSIPAIAACKKADVKHFVVTSWGDNGAEASMFSILPSLYFISESFYDDGLGNMNEFLLGLTGYTKKAWMDLDLPNQIYPSKEIRTVNPSKYLLFEDALLGDPNIKLHRSYQHTYHRIKERLKPYTRVNSDYNYIFDTIYRLTHILEDKSVLSLDIFAAYQQKNLNILRDIAEHKIVKIIKDIKKLLFVFRKQWYEENKLQGFEVQSYRFGGLIQRLEEIKDIILSYVDGHIEKIDMLDERILNVADDDDPYLGCIYYNQFVKYVTFGTF
ncbi:hypothetical protein BK010_04940 [Tenericutes bacterium MO-XQ]|nr:hypothetical protein BK010_04940 [Tenericutes bacterium MO-XQ]